jgi:hypothetical protein
MSEAPKTDETKAPAEAAAPAPAPAWFGMPRCLILGLLAAILLALLATAWWRAAAPRSAAIGGGRARLRGGRWASRGGCNCVAPPM